MAKNPTIENLRPWKPGQSGNPHGLSIVLPELLRMQRLTREEMAIIASWMVKGKADEVIKFVQDPNATILQRMIAAVFARIMEKGDPIAFEIFMNRVIGKVRMPKEESEPALDQESSQYAITPASDELLGRIAERIALSDQEDDGNPDAVLGEDERPEGGQLEV